MTEEWKDIKGFEGIYQASTNGRIKHLHTDVFVRGRHYIIEERIEEPFTWQSRYLRVDLISRRNNKRRATYVHNIIAETFLGERPKGYVVDHINGNYLDNSINNLRYVTHKQNMNNPITIKRSKEALQNYWKNISKENKDKHSKAVQLGMQNGGAEKVSKANKGRIPVYKDNDYKRIKPEELEKYINNGYTKGLPEHVINKCKENTNHVHMYGESNPAFGRRWMNNGIDRVYPKQEEFDYYLNKGYVFGMKCNLTH